MSSNEIVERTIAYAGWMKLSVLSIRMGDGRIMHREVAEHFRSAAVLPYDPERRVAILVRQFRAAVHLITAEPHFLEVVAGIIDEGNAAEAARREALEEAGLQLGMPELVAETWPSPGAFTERVSLFLATYRAEDRVAAGGGLAEEHEEIEVMEMPLADLAALADKGALRDMKTFALVQTLRLRAPELFEAAQ